MKFCLHISLIIFRISFLVSLSKAAFPVLHSKLLLWRAFLGYTEVFDRVLNSIESVFVFVAFNPILQ